MSLSATGLKKTYGRRRRWDRDEGVIALDGVDLEVRSEELVTVVGPSGSGKTTLLRCLAGLEELDDGRILIAERDVTELSPADRDVAMVFQDFALYPHLSVRDNLAFGLRARGARRREVAAKLEEVADGLGISPVLDRRPGELSGGERQRVALGRAMVREPHLFLLDEPLSNLDAELRLHARREIKMMQRRLGASMVYVTHDQFEAMSLGDRVVVLRDGKVEQSGTPDVVYDAPATAFVARFIGAPGMNLFPAHLHGPTFGSLTLGVRPEQLVLTSPGGGRFDGRVLAVEHVGTDALVHLDAGASDIVARAPWRSAPGVGAEVGVAFEERDIHVFEGPHGRSIR